MTRTITGYSTKSIDELPELCKWEPRQLFEALAAHLPA